MASSTESVSPEEFEATSKTLDSLIDDYRAIHDFATRGQRGMLLERSSSRAVLQASLDRIVVGRSEIFPVLTRCEDYIEESTSLNELRRSNCGHFAPSYHGVVMKLLDDFRHIVLKLRLFGDATKERAFEKKRSELNNKRHEKWLEKNHPLSPEEAVELDELVSLEGLTDDLENEVWGLVFEELAKKPSFEPSEIRIGMAMERKSVLKRLVPPSSHREENQSVDHPVGKEDQNQNEPNAPREDANGETTPKQNGAMGWHECHETPPKDFPHGPLTGTKSQLAKWICPPSDSRMLNKKISEGKYWGRQETATRCSVWFSTQNKFKECNMRKSNDENSANS